MPISQSKREGRLPDKRPSRRLWAVIGFLFRLLIFAVIAAFPLLLPVFRLPEPTGPYLVGTTKFHLVDRTRPETFTPASDDYREMMVQVWYPAQMQPGARVAPLAEHMPIQFSYLSRVQTHAYLDVPVSAAQASYPVLIFSPGYIGLMEQNLTQMEELASRGYIVCSIAHPYHAIATVFPDGRVILVDSTLSYNFLRDSPSTPDVYAEHLRIWTDDTLFLINELERVQAGERESLFVGKLDMARLGIFGMSFGGATATHVCAIDDRCQAGINMDGGLPSAYTGRIADSSLKQPFMFMANESRARYVYAKLGVVENIAYGIAVRGTTHFNFTDIALYSPVFKFTSAFGPIDGHRMVNILNAYTLAFFDKHLKGEAVPLLNGPSLDYPEVTIEVQTP